MQEFQDLLQNEHLNHFAGLLAIAQAPMWVEHHPQVASVRGRLDYIARIVHGGETFDVAAFRTTWIRLITDIVHADASLTYSTANLAWMEDLLENQRHARTAILLLLAVASATPRWYTCEGVAAMSDKSAVWWRKQAALAGNPWLAQQRGVAYVFNENILRAHGIVVPSSQREAETSM